MSQDNANSGTDRRKGEKIGWIGGWLGGFIWVLILSVIFLIQGRETPAVIGLVLVCLAVAFIVTGAPWRHPDTPYWKLMVPVYIAFMASIAWMVWSSRGLESLGINKWQSFLILPILIPFATVGKRRWNDTNASAHQSEGGSH